VGQEVTADASSSARARQAEQTQVGYPPEHPAALEAVDIQKVYGGTAALRGVGFSAHYGEIHALLGENGAGKSTLVRILSGVDEADAGRIIIQGEDVTTRYTTMRAQTLGLSVIHQQFSLVPALSVAENIALVAGYGGSSFIDWKETRRAGLRALDRLGVRLDPDHIVGTLPPAMQSIVAIARALALEAKILLLDEPTATLTLRESVALFEVIRRLRSSGVAVVLISHRLDEVMEYADRITVLRDGLVVHSTAREGATLRELIRHIIGRDLESGEEDRRHGELEAMGVPADRLVTMENVCAQGLANVSLDIRLGEVLGCTGLVGAGQTQLSHLLFGRIPYVSGAMRLSGTTFRPKSPADALYAGVGYVPEDRNADAVIEGMSVHENLLANPRGRLSRIINKRREKSAVNLLMDEFDIRPRDPDLEITTLSGGNAQKVVLARALSAKPKLIVLEEPTNGVDIGSRSEIHAIVRRACQEGSSAVIASSDVEEVAAVSDRVAIFRRGRVSQILEHGKYTPAQISEAINAPESR
jgi:ribose transport system ATP-binding protein